LTIASHRSLPRDGPPTILVGYGGVTNESIPGAVCELVDVIHATRK
jgi:hypothetical protein